LPVGRVGEGAVVEVGSGCRETSGRGLDETTTVGGGVVAHAADKMPMHASAIRTLIASLLSLENGEGSLPSVVTAMLAQYLARRKRSSLVRAYWLAARRGVASVVFRGETTIRAGRRARRRS
jgi:hypothetical protein